jgi:hypothetical protein
MRDNPVVLKLIVVVFKWLNDTFVKWLRNSSVTSWKELCLYPYIIE